MTMYLYNQAVECLLVSMLHLFSFIILEYPNNQRGAKGSEIRFLHTGKLFHLTNCALLEGAKSVCGESGSKDQHIS